MATTLIKSLMMSLFFSEMDEGYSSYEVWVKMGMYFSDRIAIAPWKVEETLQHLCKENVLCVNQAGLYSLIPKKSIY
jgi:hypothetical protein